MTAALVSGLRAAWRAPSLALLLLFVNVSTAAILAAPLLRNLETDLQNRGAATRMLGGFDHDWWKRWSDVQSGHEKAFGPEILGAGFAFRNLDLLLKGDLPARLFARRGEKREAGAPPAILALGAAYLALHALLAGGVLATLRASSGGFAWRAFAHACGHYAGPMVRVFLLVLAADALVFLVNVPFASWADARAHEAVTERAALAWALGRRAALLVALLGVHLVSGYAKAIVVLEERTSAVLALVSALAFLVRNAAVAVLHFASIVLLAILLAAVFVALDGAFSVGGYRTQIVALLLMQGFVLLRIGLRLALTGGQLALLRERR